MRLRLPRSIATQLVLAALVVEVVMLSLLLASNTRIMRTSLEAQFHSRLTEVERLLQSALAAPLARGDRDAAQALLDTVGTGDDIACLELTDNAGRVMALAGRRPAPGDPFERASLPVGLGDHVYGTLRLWASTAVFRQARRSLLAAGALIALGEVLLSALILAAIAYRVGDRLGKLGRASAQVAGGNLTARVDARQGRDELDRLAAGFNQMAAALEARMDELRLSQERLEAARREADAARRQSELLLATPEEGILSLDAEGRLTFINPAARRMYGWDEAEGLGALMHAAVHHHRVDGSPYPAEDCPVHQTLADGEPRRMEGETYWRRDGTPFPVECSVTAIRAGGRVTGAVLVFHDVTERLRAARQLMEKTEQLARSNADLEQFAYVASHDLREPLRMITSYMTLIERRYGQALDAEGHEFLSFARSGAVRMDQMVRDLLEFSRVGRGPEPHAPTSLAEAAAVAVQSLRLAVEEAGADIRVAPDLPTVMGNASEMARLLQNLVGNALKYRASDRTPVVEVDWRRLDGEAEIRVSDNGIGIESCYFEQIFLVFRRLHPRQAHGGGNGIGLAICKKIVERHGGRIWLDSEPGQGTTFRFTLPLAPQQAAPWPATLTTSPAIG